MSVAEVPAFALLVPVACCPLRIVHGRSSYVHRSAETLDRCRLAARLSLWATRAASGERDAARFVLLQAPSLPVALPFEGVVTNSTASPLGPPADYAASA